MRKLCESKRIKTDGTSPIYFQYFHDGVHKVFLNTLISIPPEHWSKKKQEIKDTLPVTFGNHEILNTELIRLFRLAEDLIKLVKTQDITNPGIYIKEKFHPTLNLDTLAATEFGLSTPFFPTNQKKKTAFFKQLNDYVDSKRKKVKPATITVFNNMIGHFAAFENHRKRPITFDSLDFQFYEDFVDFLTYDYQHPRKKTPTLGLKVNTIGKTIHQFRIFIKDRVKRKIIPPIDLSDYKIPTEETDAIYLTYEEIGQIYHLDLSERPDLIPARKPPNSHCPPPASLRPPYSSQPAVAPALSAQNTLPIASHNMPVSQDLKKR